MTNRFMVSVAALALIAGTGFANAQGVNKESGGAGGGAAMQHSDTSPGASHSGSSTGAPKSEANESSKGGMKSTQTEQKQQPGTMKNERVEDNNVKGGGTRERAEDRGKGTSENQRAEESKSGNTKAEGRESRENNMKAEGREGRDNNMKAEGKNGNNTAESTKSGTNNTAEGKSTTTERSQTTTGQAAGGAKLTSDQRTQIGTAIRGEHVQSMNNVNFSVSVGTRVPREGVHFYPLPERVVTIYPEWRGYDYIVVHDRIVIIDPHTYEIVEIIES